MGAVIHKRCPLVGFASKKTIELIKPLAVWPAVERAGNTGFPGSGFMPFTKRSGAVAIQPEHFRKGCNILRNFSGITGKTGGQFGYEAHVVYLVIASAFYGNACGRAYCGSMEIVVIHTL